MRLARDHVDTGPGLMTHAFRMGSQDNKTLDFVRDRIGDSISAFGGQNNLFRQLNRYYLSLSPAVEARDNDRAIITGRQDDPDLFVPITFSVIESLIPSWIFAQFGQRPFVDVMGRTQDDQDRAEAVTQMLDYDFERARTLLQAIPYAKSMFKYGTGIGEVTYRYESHKVRKRYKEKVPTGFDKFRKLMSKWEYFKRMETVIDFDGPSLDWVSPFNFGVDPLYYELDRMRYCWKRDWTDRQTLGEEDEQWKELTGKKLYKNLDLIPKIAKGFAEGVYELDASDDTSEAMGWTNLGGFKKQRYVQVRDIDRDRDAAIERITYYEDDRKVVICNGTAVVHDGENPYDDKRKPFVATPCIPLEGYFWGMGYIHPIRKSQEEVNSYRNLNMRQARLNAMNVWGVDETIDLPEQATEVSPGDVLQIPFFANGKPSIVPLMQGRPLPPESQIYEDRLLADIQRAVARSSLRMGGAGSRGIDTATEAKMMGAAEEQRVQLGNLIGEETFLQQVAKKFFWRRQQYFKEGQVFRILGKDGVNFKKLEIQEIVGDYDFMPRGSTTHVGKEVIRQQMLQGLALIGQNPAILQVANVSEIWLELWKHFDSRFPERFTIPPPDRTWSPDQENMVLVRGEFVPVLQNDNHPEHLQAHTAGASEVRDDRGLEALQDHIKKHRMYVQPAAAGGGTPPQEQPGMQGGPGQQPNPGNMRTPSEGDMAAQIGGGAQ